ncbi:Anoctamin-7 [Borealophlyctis nickersoniae]|nr:Anoctamin-7 [Borealophlyctis nickersoniae]
MSTHEPPKKSKSSSDNLPRVRASRRLSSSSPSSASFNARPTSSSAAGSTTQGQPLSMTVDRIDNRDILLLREQDVEMWREIMFQKKGGKVFKEALDTWCPLGGDALVKIAYADPTTHFDAVLLYDLADTRHEHVRTAFEVALLSAGLFLEREVAPDGVKVFLKIMCPFERLCDEAEKQKLKAPLQVRQASRKIGTLDASDTDQLWHGVVNIFRLGTGPEKYSATFRKDRIDRFVGGNMAVMAPREVQMFFFSNAQRSMLTYNIILRARMTGKKYARKDIGRLLSDGIYTVFMCCFNEPMGVKQLVVDRLLIQTGSVPTARRTDRRHKQQPPVADASFLDVLYMSRTSERPAAIFWRADSDILCVAGLGGLATLYLEFWKRQNLALAWQWDVMNFDKEERTRPQWYATTVRRSHITHRIEPHFPAQTKRCIIFTTWFIVFVAMLFVVGSVGGFVVYNSWVKWYFAHHFPEYLSYAGVTSAVVSLTTIMVLTPLTYGLSGWLTDLENHKTETQYQNAKIAKRMLFDFVNNFGSLFYVSVVKAWMQAEQITILGQDEWQDSCINDDCIVELMIQLTVVFIGRSIMQHSYHIGLPWLTRKWNSFTSSYRKSKEMRHTPVFPAESPVQYDDIEARRRSVLAGHTIVPQAVLDAGLVAFKAEDGLNDGYNVAVVQFGFIVLFSAAFPLAPLFAFIHNVIQLRIDTHNLLSQFRRPFALQAQDIGTWYHWLEAVSHLAVITNACIIAFSSNFFETHYLNLFGEDSSTRWAARLGFIMAFEHVVYGIKMLVSWIIPDVPTHVRRAIERQEFVDKVLRGEEQEDETAEDDVQPDDLKRDSCLIL